MFSLFVPVALMQSMQDCFTAAGDVPGYLRGAPSGAVISPQASPPLQSKRAAPFTSNGAALVVCDGHLPLVLRDGAEAESARSSSRPSSRPRRPRIPISAARAAKKHARRACFSLRRQAEGAQVFPACAAVYIVRLFIPALPSLRLSRRCKNYTYCTTGSEGCQGSFLTKIPGVSGGGAV